MDEIDRRALYQATPFWLWPVLWWSLGRFEAWRARYQAEHGPCEIAYAVTMRGTIRILWIGDRRDAASDPLRISRAAALALLSALTPDLVLSRPVRSPLCAFARRMSAGHGVFGASADAPEPLNLAPS